MGDKTKIEWTRSDDGTPGATWNPVTGCTKVSQGCKHCYAERLAPKVFAGQQVVNPGYGSPAARPRRFTDVRCHPDRLDQPLRWRRPRRIFVNSMSDLFHEDVPFEFIASVFAVMAVTTRHTYQVLTKRPARMLEFFDWVHRDSDGAPIDPSWFNADDRIFDNWPKHIDWKKCGYNNCGPAYPFENIWLGVSVENQDTADERIPLLLQTPAAVRFLSCEPLLGPVDISTWLSPRQCPNQDGYGGDHAPGWMTDTRIIDWVIVGGESGPQARPMHPDWVRSLRDQCVAAGVPFHFKQWGEWQEGSDLQYDSPRAACVDRMGRIVQAPALKQDFPIGAESADGWTWMRCVGKKAAGRTLDGKTWDQFPS